jgi:GTP-binding protein HflX
LSGARGHARDSAAKLEEAQGLAAAIGLDVVYAAAIALDEFRPATLMGQGKVEEIGLRVEGLKPVVVIVDGVVSPVQQRNLERAWKTKVLDRTGLILEIFGARARTREGQMQVELAHLTYHKGRLVRQWTHLERQRGGFGFLGGPGETQIELDRRIIGDRIAKLKKELVQVRRTRSLHREARKRAPFPVVALIGYTNAGKSTIFNALTKANVVAEDKLFATLDPTMRGITLPSKHRIILSDTVGFVSDLPTQLVAAFRATLEEVLEADLLIHVRDIRHPDTEAQKGDVLEVLNELGIGRDALEMRIVEVWNKIDLIPEGEWKPLTGANGTSGGARGLCGPVATSALTGQGLELLVQAIDNRLQISDRLVDLTLAASAGAEFAWLHANATIQSKRMHKDGSMTLKVRVSESNWLGFQRKFAKLAG